MMKEENNSEGVNISKDDKNSSSTLVNDQEVNENKNKTELKSNNEVKGSVGEWFKLASNSQFVKKVVKTTKNSVDKVIVTLDPGMAPYLKEGGEIDILVTSGK